jgi:hypothetical protein
VLVMGCCRDGIAPNGRGGERGRGSRGVVFRC